MIKTEIPGKCRAFRLDLKLKLSPLHSLRSARTSLVSDFSEYPSCTTPAAFPNCNAVFSCLSETSQGAVCVAGWPVCTANSYCFLEIGSSNSLFTLGLRAAQICILDCQSKDLYFSSDSTPVIGRWPPLILADLSSYFGLSMVIAKHVQYPTSSCTSSDN